MIERAIILKIQKEQPNVQLFIKLILMINRIYYPQMIAITVFSSTLLLFLNVSIYYYVYIFLLMQTIFISIAWHECIHISFARFLSYEPIFVSFLPYTFGARTHFERSRKIENLDKAGILLAAPIILTIIGFISLWISIKWIHSFASIIFICAFLLINILSLLPNKKCDGGRAYEIFKKMGFKAFSLCIGSIYIMNNIFMFGYRLHSDRANIQSAVTAVILLGVNVLVFYIYIKLADDLQLRRMTSVYEQQLDLCERHQQERELSILRLRDVRHNMKNNLVSILAYAENGDNEKIIRFVNEIMEEGGIKTSTVTNSGNIVIDSLIGYWYVEAKKVGIDFSVNLNIPMEMPFRGADICLILGNLLENAVEAAQKAEGKKYIRFHMKYDKNNLLLFVENNYKGVLIKTKDKRLKSTKTDAGNHGVGLSSVYRIAAKYHGVVTIDDDVANRFLIRVVLYGKQE